MINVQVRKRDLTNPNGALILDFSPLELWGKKFLFKPSSLWHFVMVAQADKYSVQVSVQVPASNPRNGIAGGSMLNFLRNHNTIIHHA